MSAPALDDGAFRASLGHFASGVTVVSTVVAGVDHALTASAFTSVSLDPPLVCVNIGRRNRFLPAVLESRVWAVSVLSEAGQGAATWFADSGRPLQTQFDSVPHSRGRLSGAALVDAAVAWLECRTWAEHDGGDHVMLVGEVLAAQVPSSTSPPERPLLYYRSDYGALLRSAASEHSDVTLRAAIIDDDAQHRPQRAVDDRSGRQ